MLKKRKLYGLLAISAVIFAGLACNFNMPQAATETPTPQSAVDVEAVEKQINEAIATGVSGGDVTLLLTEAQLTATANKELQASGEDRIQNLNIQLDDGIITISGDANQDGLSLPVVITVKINVDADGLPHTEILSGRLGPFPLPQSMLDQVTAQLDQALQAELEATASNLFVKEITIADGKITIIAQAR